MIQSLIIKNNIKVNKEIQALSERGVEIMLKSKDKLHDDLHIRELYHLYSEFLKNCPEVNIDPEIVIPAIAWHDVWKSKREQETNIIKFVWIQLYEGIGSARMFKESVRVFQIDPALVQAINYCIRHHSPWHDTLIFKNISVIPSFLKLKTSEAQLIRDLDWLDFFSMKRLEHFKDLYCDEKGYFKDQKSAKLAKVLFGHARNNFQFNFDWTQAEFEKRREKIIQEAKKVFRINNPK